MSIPRADFVLYTLVSPEAEAAVLAERESALHRDSLVELY
jgi:hypothetical protein